MEKLIRQIASEIGLDVLELNEGWDFDGTVKHYTRLADELSDKLNDDELYEKCYEMLLGCYNEGLKAIENRD